MTWCNKTAKCKHCSQPITPGEPLVRGKLWRKHGQATRWSYKFYWHPQCWVEQGLIGLRSRPRVSPFRGAITNRDITPEDKTTRLRLLQKRANIVQRMKKAGIEQNLDLLISLQEKLEELIPEIEKVGGVPKGWKRGDDADLITVDEIRHTDISSPIEVEVKS